MLFSFSVGSSFTHTHTHTNSCENRLTGVGPPLTLDYCRDMMTDLQTKYPVEYAAYNLSSIAVAVFFPLIKKQLQVSGVLSTYMYAVMTYGGPECYL